MTLRIAAALAVLTMVMGGCGGRDQVEDDAAFEPALAPSQPENRWIRKTGV